MGDGFEPMQIDDFAEENENDLNILAVNGVNNVRYAPVLILDG